MPRGAAFDNSPSATIPDLTGCVISNDRLHLRLATVIGRGGYGVVYKAEAVGASHESYAVKCINTSALREGERRSISREIQLQSACAKASKSVLCIEDVIVYDEEGYVFIITELCEGGDLLDHLLKGDFHGKDDLIRDSFVQIIDAVDACHRRGVYHRDLKPENIFCKKDGSLVLGDFGLATTSRNTRDFNTGSLPFMSPEVLGGLANERKPYSSPRADIWSLGVILLNLINAKLPWQKARAIDKVDKRGNIDACCDYFRTYLCNRRTYFHSEDFCVSREVGETLGSVFAVDPRKRITLADLRTRVQNTRTF
ncbi:kinase-like domain-containing protein, partial [Phellopilus nigrolimitatus]